MQCTSKEWGRKRRKLNLQWANLYFYFIKLLGALFGLKGQEGIPGRFGTQGFPGPRGQKGPKGKL